MMHSHLKEHINNCDLPEHIRDACQIGLDKLDKYFDPAKRNYAYIAATGKILDMF